MSDCLSLSNDYEIEDAEASDTMQAFVCGRHMRTGKIGSMKTLGRPPARNHEPGS